ALEVKDYEEFAGLGTTCIYKKHKITTGNRKFLMQQGIFVEDELENGTIVHCAKDKEYLGYVVVNDKIKEEAKAFVDGLHKENIEVIMLTGDHHTNGQEVGKELGIDRVFTDLLPDDKRAILDEEMSTSSNSVAFIGDGINDAPSIKRSDVGIAMGGIGSDVAIENADVVIMNDNPNKLITAIKISKKAKHTSIFNIAFALTIKLAVLILAIIFPKWSYMMYVAIFSDTGLTVLLTINSLLLLQRKVK
nr:HAD-IC family P-type ATPase [Bacilli bacterium]